VEASFDTESLDTRADTTSPLQALGRKENRIAAGPGFVVTRYVSPSSGRGSHQDRKPKLEACTNSVMAPRRRPDESSVQGKIARALPLLVVLPLAPSPIATVKTPGVTSIRVARHDRIRFEAPQDTHHGAEHQLISARYAEAQERRVEKERIDPAAVVREERSNQPAGGVAREQHETGSIASTDPRDRLGYLLVVLGKVAYQTRSLMASKRTPMFPQVQRIERPAGSGEAMSHLCTEEVVVVPVEIEDGAVPSRGAHVTNQRRIRRPLPVGPKRN